MFLELFPSVCKGFYFEFKQSSCGVLRLDEAGAFRHHRALYFLSVSHGLDTPLADYTQRCHWPSWKAPSRKMTAIPHQRHRAVILGSGVEWQFFLLNLHGKLSDRMSTHLPFFTVKNTSPITAHSRGNRITESSGLGKTCWGHLTSPRNLNMEPPAPVLPEQGCWWASLIGHTPPAFQGCSALSKVMY